MRGCGSRRDGLVCLAEPSRVVATAPAMLIFEPGRLNFRTIGLNSALTGLTDSDLVTGTRAGKSRSAPTDSDSEPKMR